MGQLPKSRGSYNSYRSLCNKLLQNLAASNTTHIRSPGFHGSGIRAQPRSALCFGMSHEGTKPGIGQGGCHLKVQLGQDALPSLLSGAWQDPVAPFLAGWWPRPCRCQLASSRQRTSTADGSLWSSNQRSETLHACRILFMRSPQVRLTLTGR